MSGYRNILWLLPVTLLLSWPIWGGAFVRILVPRGGLLTNLAMPKTTTTGAGFSMEGVLFSQLKNGELDWQIKAQRLYTKEDQNRMQLEKVEAQVFKNAERRFVIIGQQGEYNSKKKNLTIRNGVKVQAENGLLIQADSLNYDEQARKITTRAPVQITGKGLDIHGQGMDYDLQHNSYDVSGRVKVDLR
ncbi:MAG: LPS export ABC transporter periplasmic protein LptC [Deltaproteobacteria bacterium RIFOXYD12_FULL_53_23]|nr:MAG: LPS export ABC transporter periplasmic protein LptC [Deltaproteobacteria bacterium RIFOXYD12_FULL_53_23]